MNDGFALGPPPATISSKPGMNPTLRRWSARIASTSASQSARLCLPSEASPGYVKAPSLARHDAGASPEG